MKALFFTGLAGISFLICGFLFTDNGNNSLKQSDTYNVKTANNQKEKKQVTASNLKEIKYKKLETKSIDEEMVEPVIMVDNNHNRIQNTLEDSQEVPQIINNTTPENEEVIANSLLEEEEEEENVQDLIMEEQPNNSSEEHTKEVKETISLLSKSLETAQSIDELKPIANKLDSLDTISLKEAAVIQNDLEKIQDDYHKILLVDDFLKKTDTLLSSDKTKEEVADIKEEYTEQNIEQLITNIPNINLKNNYQAKLNEVKNVLTDNTAPSLNIGDNQVINADFQLEIADDNNYQALLNGQELTDLNITENGEYELKVTDDALNETTVHFKMEKPVEEQAEETIYTEINDESQEEATTSTRYPMNNWYLTQDYSGKGGHMGIDMGSSNKKEEIYPIANGKVVYVGQDTNGANLVQIMHDINGEQVFSTYAHMREVFLNDGQEVTTNDLLGIMGATGNATGPHLHLETATCAWEYNCTYSNYKNSLVSPWTYLPQN